MVGPIGATPGSIVAALFCWLLLSVRDFIVAGKRDGRIAGVERINKEGAAFSPYPFPIKGRGEAAGKRLPSLGLNPPPHVCENCLMRERFPQEVTTVRINPE